MPVKLHIDIETYSSENLLTSGVYRYVEAIDFEILMIAYAFDNAPVRLIDLANGEEYPEEFTTGIYNPDVEKWAQNALFERICFKAWGIDIPAQQWRCSAIKAAFCGLPLGLGDLSKILGLTDKAKLTTGKALIRYFCIPCKPTKANQGRQRNMPEHAPEKWEDFKTYCINDVEAEREIGRILKPYKMPDFEWQLYFLDQKINDAGVNIDLQLALNAIELDRQHSEKLFERIRELTGVSNPNSAPMLRKWLEEETGIPVPSLAKDVVPELIALVGEGKAKEVLELRLRTSKTSIKKYKAMTLCVADDGKAHGLLQFYGAMRTARWAGRLIQVQNLAKNYLDDLAEIREFIKTSDYETVSMFFENISTVLSQLIRTGLVAPEGKTLGVADFSAIEARVLAWLAGEQWRLDVFKTHGKIYEASAAAMFNMDIEKITKTSPERAKGKVAELALGYQGSVGALIQMGGHEMGLSEHEMVSIKNRWRLKNPKIVKLWELMNKAAILCIKTKKTVVLAKFKNIKFRYARKVMSVELPSGRRLHYQDAEVFQKTTKTARGDWTREAVRYKGIDSNNKQWVFLDTYGGKLTENVTQAIARDILAESLIKVDAAGFEICMHVHDEIAANLEPKRAEKDLTSMCEIMSQPIEWAEGLPLAADGYITPFYKKD